MQTDNATEPRGVHDDYPHRPDPPDHQVGEVVPELPVQRVRSYANFKITFVLVFRT